MYQHSCPTKSNHIDRQYSIINRAITVNKALTPSQIQGNAIISDLRGRKSWEDVEETVKKTSSVKKISNEKIKQQKVIQPFDGLDAIEELKLYTDTKDKLLTYDLNKNAQYVLKMSTDMMKIAGDMNVEGDNFVFSMATTTGSVDMLP